jgi:hypothetical protein
MVLSRVAPQTEASEISKARERNASMRSARNLLGHCDVVAAVIHDKPAGFTGLLLLDRSISGPQVIVGDGLARRNLHHRVRSPAVEDGRGRP